MIFEVTRRIEQVLNEKEVNCHIVEEEKASRVIANYRLKAGNRIVVQFISSDESNSVAIRIFEFVHASDEQKAALLNAVNEMNRKYRYVKFVLDDDNDVDIEMDIPARVEDAGEVAYELLVRAIMISDEAYPHFMKALWN